MKNFFKKPAVRAIFYLSMLALVMNLLRLLLAENAAYVWLNWNLFLALVPLLLAYTVMIAKYRSLALIMSLVWIGFLPNAPYLVTDFIHLADVGPRSLLWFDAIMMFVYSVVGVLSYIVSLRIITQRFRWRWYLPTIIGILTGFGVYLGRYIRFNSWHVVTQPFDIIKVIGNIIIHPSQHTPVLTMTFSFAIFLTVIYFISSSYILHEKTID